ncbi:MAG TPA: MFS transporter [Thermotogota bacterium]|nr:MFS transporter [Thermotogota bacterium]
MKRNFTLFLSGRFVSLLGSEIQRIVIPLFILQLTGSGTMMGLFLMFSTIPSLVFLPFAGVIGDRVNKKKAMIICDFLSGGIILIMACLTHMQLITFELLLILQIPMAIITSFFGVATSSFMPLIIERKNILRANSIKSVLDNIAMIAGPSLAGVLFGFAGIEIVFILNAISFIVSAISELFIQYKHVKPEPFKGNILKLFFSQTKEGLLYIKSDRQLVLLLLFGGVILNFLIAPFIGVIVPYVSRQVLGFSSTQFGLLESVASAGILTSSLLMAVLSRKVKNKTLFSTGMIAQSVALIVYSLFVFPAVRNSILLTPWLLFTFIAISLFLYRFFNSIVSIPLMSHLQLNVKESMLSRFFSLLTLFKDISIPLGMALFGFLLDKVQTHVLLSVISIVGLLISIIFIRKIELK